MIPKSRRPTHPGIILKEMYLNPRKISLRALSRSTGISPKHLSNIVHGKVRISAETATKLGATLKTTPNLWMNAQQHVDIYDAGEKLRHWEPQEVFPGIR